MIIQALRRPATLSWTAIIRRVVYVLAGLLITALAVIVVYPSAILIKNSLSTSKGVLTLQNYATLLTDSDMLSVLSNSLTVSLAGTLGATFVGVLLAWVVARTDVPWNRLWRSLLILPYLMPPFIGAIAWVYLLGPVGYINRAFMAITGSTEPLFVIYGQTGIILVMIFYSYPIAYMMNLSAFERTNPALEEAARISGAGVGSVIKDVTLPLAFPTIGASAILIFLSLLSNFGIPAVIGFSERYFVLTTKIYATILNYAQPNNLQLAAAQSMILVLLALIVMFVQRRLRSRGSYAVVSGISVQRQLVELRWLKGFVAGLLLLMIGLVVVAPLLAILLTALMRAPGVALIPENLTLAHFQELLFGVPKVQRAMMNSIFLAALSATVITIASVIIAYAVVRLKMRGGYLVDMLVAIPYTIPGTVVALAMILSWSQPVMGVVLYNTMWIILIAYIARFLIFGVRTTNSAFEQIHESLDEAARISGADEIQALKDITVPLIRSSLFAGWFLSFVPALAELTLSILLFSVNNETLGTVVFGLQQEGKVNMTAALALMVTGLVLVLNLFALRLGGKERTV